MRVLYSLVCSRGEGGEHVEVEIHWFALEKQ
jgi:hypothetical protein